jgi:RNA polymerase sigma-70 factor (ECF subfamily)
MNDREIARRLSSITTYWSEVQLAHQGAPDAAALARRQVLERYQGAVYRYLLGALRDPDAADELFQDFALRFIRGDFKRADPDRGRFRDFVKTALINLVSNYRQRKRPLPLQAGEQLPAPAAGPDNIDQELADCWRDELLARGWQALAALEEESGKPYHTVLRLRADCPQLSSNEMAEQLGARLGKSFSAEALRQALHRAREKFAELLIAEVAQSLETDDPDRIEQELLDLGLFPYCRGAWKPRGPSS